MRGPPPFAYHAHRSQERLVKEIRKKPERRERPCRNGRRVPRGSGVRRITKESLGQLKNRLGDKRSEYTCIERDGEMSLQVEFGALRYRGGMLPLMAQRWTVRGFHCRLSAGIWKAIKTSKETILRVGRSPHGTFHGSKSDEHRGETPRQDRSTLNSDA